MTEACHSTARVKLLKSENPKKTQYHCTLIFSRSKLTHTVIDFSHILLTGMFLTIKILRRAQTIIQLLLNQQSQGRQKYYRT
uniref:Uncharacterized protein n=1 Tax=Podarcis muralis TaxID=64176 RepID=A0A670J849_PODMU